jgi:two-component system chemotaxis response regulator CheY
MYHVLVVEDDAVAADMVEVALLRIPGLLVHCVRSAADARRVLATGKRFSAVITDVHLPGEDGLSLAEAIRRMDGFRCLPVIVVTSSKDAALKARAQAAGVHAFFEKPWSAVQLQDTVNSLLNAT